MSFKLLKQKSNDSKKLEKLVNALDKDKKSYDDDGSFWSLKRDKDGNGTAIIRFLPASEGDEDLPLPVVKIFSHRFKGKTGKYYINNCRSTIGEDDPVNDWNSKLWNTGDEQLQNYVRSHSKRKLNYIANILVVVDPQNPENEGKVFKFSFGVRIFEKIESALRGNPTLRKEGIDVFDYWKGANFAIIAKKSDGQVNYNDSYFESPSVISFNDDKELSDKQIEELIYSKQYKLTDEIAPDKFKSYEELKKLLERAIGTTINGEADVSSESEAKLSKTKVAEKKQKAEEQKDSGDVPSGTTSDSDSDSDDEVDAIFADLELDL